MRYKLNKINIIKPDFCGFHFKNLNWIFSLNFMIGHSLFFFFCEQSYFADWGK